MWIGTRSGAMRFRGSDASTQNANKGKLWRLAIARKFANKNREESRYALVVSSGREIRLLGGNRLCSRYEIATKPVIIFRVI
jgi:hypothetical protein